MIQGDEDREVSIKEHYWENTHIFFILDIRLAH